MTSAAGRAELTVKGACEFARRTWRREPAVYWSALGNFIGIPREFDAPNLDFEIKRIAKTGFETSNFGCLARHGLTHVVNSWDAIPFGQRPKEHVENIHRKKGGAFLKSGEPKV